jgi:acyl carrier protein
MSHPRTTSRSAGSVVPTTIGAVKQTLRDLIEENAGIPGDLIHDDATIAGELAMDSFSFLSLQVAVEETFGITCAPEDLEARSRFDAIARYVLEQVGAQSAAADRRLRYAAVRGAPVDRNGPPGKTKRGTPQAAR